MKERAPSASSGPPGDTWTCSATRCSTSTTSRTSCGSSTCSRTPKAESPIDPAKLANPARHLSDIPRSPPVGAADRQTCGRARLRGAGPRSARAPGALPRRSSARRRSRAISSTPGRAAAARRSSCGAFSRPTRSRPPGLGRRSLRRAAIAAERRNAVPARPEHRAGRRSRASTCSTTASSSGRGPRAHARRGRRSATDRAAAYRLPRAREVRGRSRRTLRPRRSGRVRDRRRLRVERCRGGRRGVPRRARSRRSRSSRSTGAAVAWRKASGDAPERSRLGAPPPPRAAPTGRDQDLGVVVVVHNMRREARRTLHSLSRSYQRGIDDLDYEVIVVENGSDPEQRLGEEFVRSFGPEFRYIDLGEDATPSPRRRDQPRHRRLDRPRNLALMIDGAHVLTPGVLRYGMLGLSTYAPAIVAAKHWYVGPGPAAGDGRRRLRPGARGPALRRDRLADRRLPAVRDRPLHRRPRLVRRRLGEQLHLRARAR